MSELAVKARTDRGFVVVVRFSADMAEHIASCWPPVGLTTLGDHRGPADREWRVLPPGDEPRVLVDDEEMPGGWARLESDLALVAAEHLSGVVAVHAALVMHGGRALMVPGSSMVGKSTLCIAAHELGADVLTDEYALVDPSTGLVTGWRRAVRQRLPGGGVRRLHLAVEAPPVPVGLVALVTYEQGLGGRVGWSPIAPIDAALGLMANTVCASSRPDESLDAALIIARHVTAVSGARGEARPAVAALLALLDAC